MKRAITRKHTLAGWWMFALVVIAFTVITGAAFAVYPPAPPEDVTEPVATSSRTLAASDRTPGGTAYDVYVYDSDAGLCVDIYVSADGNTGGACGTQIQAGQQFAEVLTGTSGAETIVAGPVAPDVAKLTVDAGTGVKEVVPAPVAGRSFGLFHAALAPVPGSDVPSIAITAFSSDGRIIDSNVSSTSPPTEPGAVSCDLDGAAFQFTPPVTFRTLLMNGYPGDYAATVPNAQCTRAREDGFPESAAVQLSFSGTYEPAYCFEPLPLHGFVVGTWPDGAAFKSAISITVDPSTVPLYDVGSARTTGHVKVDNQTVGSPVAVYKEGGPCDGLTGIRLTGSFTVASAGPASQGSLP